MSRLKWGTVTVLPMNLCGSWRTPPGALRHRFRLGKTSRRKGFNSTVYKDPRKTLQVPWASSQKLHKMLSGKEFWRSLACFVTGGIITVILIKMLERNRDGNNEAQGDRRILIPEQEVGDGEREVERVVPALRTNIRKFPQEQDEF